MEKHYTYACPHFHASMQGGGGAYCTWLHKAQDVYMYCECLPPFFVYVSGSLLTMDAAPMSHSDIASDEL